MTSLANALEPSSSAASRTARSSDPALAHGVGDAGDERRLGPDDDQVGAERGGQVGDRRAVQRVDVVQGGEPPRMPGLPGAACTSVTAGIAGEGERERVLAAAGADDEGLHARRC